MLWCSFSYCKKINDPQERRASTKGSIAILCKSCLSGNTLCAHFQVTLSVIHTTDCFMWDCSQKHTMYFINSELGWCVSKKENSLIFKKTNFFRGRLKRVYTPPMQEVRFRVKIEHNYPHNCLICHFCLAFSVFLINQAPLHSPTTHGNGAAH